MSSLVVTPGLRLGSTTDFQAGPGVYVRNGSLYASALGQLKKFIPHAPALDTDDNAPSTISDAEEGKEKEETRATSPPPTTDIKPILVVGRSKPQSVVPHVGNMVIGKVLRINTRVAAVAIMMVNTTLCLEDYQGVIRIQDVRATEKDKVQMHRSFRPGDIVRAQVISLGDARSYYLSTARNELGVIMAQSEAGETMVPISWEEMQCPATKLIEYRKCAKPF
ncbi:hypothetical protein IWQ62_003951 [Dispira parvispora]|uniref:S1 motif domain-containing protein n=1 Tax=Dispira parvispora TaxID=1520584 RepID=A0A9W8ALW8_9FUNG|nr:hypothetical protein IWQ62_003951 [Dispira parvispora]